MTSLCRLDAIADPGGKGLALPGPDGRPREIVVVRSGRAVWGYVNACPHAGTPLDFLPDRFLTADGTELLCGTHGARFALETGLCVAGPCVGRSLAPVCVRLEGEMVVLAAPLG